MNLYPVRDGFTDDEDELVNDGFEEMETEYCMVLNQSVVGSAKDLDTWVNDIQRWFDALGEAKEVVCGRGEVLDPVGGPRTMHMCFESREARDECLNDIHHQEGLKDNLQVNVKACWDADLGCSGDIMTSPNCVKLTRPRKSHTIHTRESVEALMYQDDPSLEDAVEGWRTAEEKGATVIRIYAKTKRETQRIAEWAYRYDWAVLAPQWAQHCQHCNESNHTMENCEGVMHDVRVHMSRANVIHRQTMADALRAEIIREGTLWFDIRMYETTKTQGSDRMKSATAKGHMTMVRRFSAVSATKRRDWCERCGGIATGTHQDENSCPVGRGSSWTIKKHMDAMKGSKAWRINELLKWDEAVRAGPDVWRAKKYCMKLMWCGRCEKKLQGNCRWEHVGAPEGLVYGDVGWRPPPSDGICPQAFIGQVCRTPTCVREHRPGPAVALGAKQPAPTMLDKMLKCGWDAEYARQVLETDQAGSRVDDRPRTNRRGPRHNHCHAWLAGDPCRFGDNCRYDHTPSMYGTGNEKNQLGGILSQTAVQPTSI